MATFSLVHAATRWLPEIVGWSSDSMRHTAGPEFQYSQYHGLEYS